MCGGDLAFLSNYFDHLRTLLVPCFSAMSLASLHFNADGDDDMIDTSGDVS